MFVFQFRIRSTNVLHAVELSPTFYLSRDADDVPHEARNAFGQTNNLGIFIYFIR